MTSQIDDTDSVDRVNKPNIWSKSLELLESSKPLEQCYLYGYSTMLFIGSQCGGKSTIIDRFIALCNGSNWNKDESNVSYVETIGLHYRFAQRKASNVVDQLDNLPKICEIWELGYGLLFTNLVQFALTPDTLRNSSVVMVVDLTRPEEMSTLMETLLAKVRKHIDLIGADLNINSDLEEQAFKRISVHRTPDKNELDSSMKPFPLPLTIIGSKYDEFQNMDPEKKKQIVRYLRTVSYYNGGQIVFVSSKSETLTKRLYQSLESLAFERTYMNKKSTVDDATSDHSTKPSVSTGHTKPLWIPFGYDTPQKIGINSVNLKELQQNFHQLFPQQSIHQLYVSTMGADPRTDPNFSEPEIDKILEYKYMMINDSKKQNLN